MIRSLPAAFALALVLATSANATAPNSLPAPTPNVAAPPPATDAHAAAPVPAPPTVTARSWILMDHFSGRVLAQERPDERAEPASLTKLMTAYVVFTALAEGRLKLTDMATISEHAWRAEGSRTFVQVGTRIPVDILLKGMIVQSGNDATIALAEQIGGTEAAFAQMMNEYARRLGLTGTHYLNSDGLPSSEHYTTARDVATLANALIRDYPQYYSLFSTRQFSYLGRTTRNHNHLLGSMPGVDGIKTGFTNASGFNLMTSMHRDGRSLVAVVMGGRSAGARDALMEQLLYQHFAQASAGARTAPMIAEASEAEPMRVAEVERPRGGAAICTLALQQRSRPLWQCGFEFNRTQFTVLARDRRWQ